jgi:rRNA maturation endonuclease Nob1
MNDTERYKLVCWRCEREIELAAGPADRREVRECPHCGARLELEWRPEAAA